jgi:hypothetical protein
MQCILYKIYFWKVFHMYYNLICIFICTPMWTKFYSCKKWVLHILIVHIFPIVVHIPLLQRVRCKTLLRPPQVAWLSAGFLRFVSLTPALSH